MMRKRWGLGGLVAASALVVSAASCSNARVGNYDNPEPQTGFDPADGGVEASVDVEVKYCAVTTCSAPWQTCESSKFPCDVDLTNDDDNCGACRVRCIGEVPGTFSKWSCVAGQCTFACTLGRTDCDGDPSNGCEAYTLDDPENCGLCGNKCKDGLWCDLGACKPRCEVLGQPDECGDTCTDLKRDDTNCGNCGVVCDATGPDKPALPEDMYYGCSNGSCGVPKCLSAERRNCNGKIEDGCEVELGTDQNCTECGDACAPGKKCGWDGSRTRCICDDGETYCNTTLVGGCKQLNDDPLHCGGCNHVCPGMQTPHFIVSCINAVCGGKCEDRYADCDGLAANGCEVDTQVDNRNCGACGNACLVGQVCSGGKCLVKPCDPGSPEETTK